MLDLSAVAFVDVETSGLDLERHEIWECALIVDDEEHHWFLPVDLGRADPVALAVGGYYERHPSCGALAYIPDFNVADIRWFATKVEQLSRGRALVGANVSFDMYRLDRLLRANGACPGWHYRPIDVEALAVGAVSQLGVDLPVPWDSTDVAERLGIDRGLYEKHTALGDALWARAIYTAVMQ